jgi:hypothetical protein
MNSSADLEIVATIGFYDLNTVHALRTPSSPCSAVGEQKRGQRFVLSTFEG